MASNSSPRWSDKIKLKRRIFPKKVRWAWYYKLLLTNISKDKVRIGFGPIVEGENTLGVRRYRIDPIVNWINRYSERYKAGIFLSNRYIDRFDIVLVVKAFDGISGEHVADLQRAGKRIVFDIVDNPYCGGPARQYDQAPDFISAVDQIIVSNPLQAEDVGPWNKNTVLIEHPVINTRYYRHGKLDDRTIRIVWTGFKHNFLGVEKLHPVIARLRKETGRDIRMVYLSNDVPERQPYVDFVPWRMEDWEKKLASCDIGVTLKPATDYYQRRKPSTKVLTYFAAGLPVACSPSPADRQVMKHGEHGYFADTEDEWYTALKTLVSNEALRNEIGSHNRKYALDAFSIEQIGKKYLQLFDLLSDAEGARG